MASHRLAVAVEVSRVAASPVASHHLAVAVEVSLVAASLAASHHLAVVARAVKEVREAVLARAVKEAREAVLARAVKEARVANQARVARVANPAALETKKLMSPVPLQVSHQVPFQLCLLIHRYLSSPPSHPLQVSTLIHH